MSALQKWFAAALEKSPAPGGRTSVVMPGSGLDLRPRGLVKVCGTVDGHPLRNSFTAMGDGSQKLSIKRDVRNPIGREAGDTVAVRLLKPIGG